MTRFPSAPSSSPSPRAGGRPSAAGRAASRLAAVAWLTGCAWAAVAESPAGIELAEEAAFQAAAAAVAPAVVRVEVAGVSEEGLTGNAEATPASGPSSGLVVGEDGWIVTTAFAVPKDVSQVVVTLADGSRRVARAVGRDLARGVVLLRIDLAEGEPRLPVPETAPRADLRVGQWTIVLGRTWASSAPSVGVGILSATNRAWGRAVQTDCSVSPANYGGPLVDISGRVIGVLAPLPAETAGMNAGTELYDSGIGFAVPLEDIRRVLPRLQAGETVAPGVMGIGWASRDPFTAPPVIATCRAGSPAARAGLRAGDTIVEAAGVPVRRVAEVRHALARFAAGDVIDLTVERGDARERVPARVELAASLPPWRRPVLGIVPARGATGNGDAAGPTVAWTWPGGPAAAAGVAAGDRIVAVRRRSSAGEEDPALPVADAAALEGVMGGFEAGDVVEVNAVRDGEARSFEVTIAARPTAVPAEVPVSDADVGAATIEKIEAAEIGKPAWLVAPPADASRPVGVLVFCAPPGAAAAGRGADAEEAVRRAAELWKGAATRHGVAVVLPQPADPQRWGREDLRTLARTLDGLRVRRPVDPARVAFAGSGPGGAFAWLAAEALGPAARGVALLDAALPRQAEVETTEPGRAPAVLFGSSPGAAVARIDADVRRLESAGYPVGLLPELVGDPVPMETLCAWVEALGVL